MDCANRMAIDNKVRMLWMQYSEWTEMTFTGIILGNPNEEIIIKRLLQSPRDFAIFLKNLYGEEIAYRFGKLLTDHLSLTVVLVELIMAEDAMEAEKIDKKLYENADEISGLLSEINPYWHYQSWRNMLYAHLDLAKTMVEEKLNGRYKRNINTYDQFESETMVMANMMTEGIIRQFFQLGCS